MPSSSATSERTLHRQVEIPPQPLQHMGSSLNLGPFWIPNVVRHPYKMDPKRDRSLENYPHEQRHLLSDAATLAHLAERSLIIGLWAVLCYKHHKAPAGCW